MDEAHHKHCFLVVHPSTEIREIISLSLGSYFQAEIVSAASGQEALLRLPTNPKIEILIAHFDSAGDSGQALQEHLAREKDKRPLIIISNYPGDAMAAFGQAESVTILEGPDLVRPLRRKVSTLLGRKNKATATPEPYCKIPAAMVLRLGVLFCDLFIKLSENKYIRIMHAANPFDMQDLKHFQQKKIAHFYIKNEDSERYLEHVLRVLSSLPSHIEVGETEAFQLSSSAIEIVSSIQNTVGFTKEARELTTTCVQMTVHTIKKHPVLRDLWGKFTIDPEAYIPSHSMALAHIACGVASLLDWISDVTFYKLSLAAFLHDITLITDSLAEVRSWSDLLSKRHGLTEQEFNAIIGHPEQAAGLARTIGGLPPDVDTVLSQHHERPDGSGFPKSIKAVDIHPLSAVFIVAHEMINARFANGEQTIDRFLQQLSPAWNTGAFKEITKTLKGSSR